MKTPVFRTKFFFNKRELEDIKTTIDEEKNDLLTRALNAEDKVQQLESEKEKTREEVNNLSKRVEELKNKREQGIAKDADDGQSA